MSGIGDIWRQLLGIVFGGACVLGASCATAQITPDRTLPNNSSVTINGSVFNITGGTQAGRNLFHSFQQFSVPIGGTASFLNGADVQNIISRVTGGSVSNIDGLIRASGTANVFFLNPSGIVFGRNASLNVGGSFVATTANAIQFGNQGFFSASSPNNPTLLTVNPSALLYNQLDTPAAIQNSSIAPAGIAPTGANSFGLRVPDGQSLLLVGGDIQMDGGRSTAYGGRVELGGLAAPGTIGLQVNGRNLSLSFPDNVTRSDVSLTNQASVRVDAAGGGSIAVNARNLDISGSSTLIAGIAPDLGNVGATAGDITVNATGAATIAGDGSKIFNGVGSGASGRGGNIAITADSLLLADSAVIDASTAGQGDSGKVSIQAKGTVFLTSLSTIFNVVDPRGIGNSGGITVDAGRLLITDGAEFQASTSGKGNAGNVTIQAREQASFDGVGSDGNSSGIFSTVFPTGEGKAGNIKITSRSLSLTNGAFVLSNTRELGNAGNITIQASDSISIDGTGSNRENSGVYTTVGDGVGNGGDIKITTGLLSLTNGGVVDAATFAQGNAGNIVVDAIHAILINGVGEAGIPSRILTAVNSTAAVGQGGDITLTTGKLEITNSAQLNAISSGQGNAGNIGVNARFIQLNNQAAINADTTSGNGGTIKLQVQDLLLLRRNSNISTTAGITQAGGDGGNITINAPYGFIVAVSNENNDITANAFNGAGGKIQINATDLFNIAPLSRQDLERLRPQDLDPSQLPTNDITAVSQQNADLNGIVQITTPEIDPSRSLVNLPTVTENTPKLIPSSCAAFNEITGGSNFTITGRGGLPLSPYEPLTSDVVWTDTRLPTTTTQHLRKTHVALPKPQPISIIPATGWVFNGNSEVTLISKATKATSSSTPTSCPAR